MNPEETNSGLADHETRISALEGSLHYREGESPQERLDVLEQLVGEKSKERLWSPSQWERVGQLEGLVLNLQGKLNEHLDKKNRRWGKY